MVEAQEKEAIAKGMQTLWIIWAAMPGSLLIYIFICLQLGEGFMGTERTEVPIDLLRNIFFAVGAVTFFIAFFLRRTMLSVRAGLPKSKLNAAPFVPKYATAVIVSLALSEGIGIYGFVLFLLGDSFQTLYTFIAVSALAMVFYRPKRVELERLAVAYKKRDESVPEM